MAPDQVLVLGTRSWSGSPKRTHIIMLSPKLKWPREANCIPNSSHQPISNIRTRLAHNKQVVDLFLIQSEIEINHHVPLSISQQLKKWSDSWIIVIIWVYRYSTAGGGY